MQVGVGFSFVLGDRVPVVWCLFCLVRVFIQFWSVHADTSVTFFKSGSGGD